MTGRWFEVKLAPGTANPARLIPLPVKPWSWTASSYATPGTVFATALSPDGQELAVADVPPVPAADLKMAPDWQEVKVFATATGRLLHDWTEHDHSSAFGDVNPMTPTLTWVDGDRSLLLVTGNYATSEGTVIGTVRRLDMAGPARGDLKADSAVIWSGTLSANSGYGCYAADSWPPLISADGHSVSCTNYAELKSGPAPWMASIDTDPLPPGPGAAFKPRFDFKLTSPLDQQGKPLAGGADLSLLWVSANGGTVIGTWHYIENRPSVAGVHFGVISHGRVTPLALPANFANLGPGQIAW
jgi:hypothetical protein